MEIIDLTKYNVDRDAYDKIGECAILELSKKINKGVDELSLDHFYNMGDFDGDENLHVLEISFDDEEDDEFLNTSVLKEIGGLVFELKLRKIFNIFQYKLKNIRNKVSEN